MELHATSLPSRRPKLQRAFCWIFLRRPRDIFSCVCGDQKNQIFFKGKSDYLQLCLKGYNTAFLKRPGDNSSQTFGDLNRAFFK